MVEWRLRVRSQRSHLLCKVLIGSLKRCTKALSRVIISQATEHLTIHGSHTFHRSRPCIHQLIHQKPICPRVICHRHHNWETNTHTLSGPDVMRTIVTLLPHVLPSRRFTHICPRTQVITFWPQLRSIHLATRHWYRQHFGRGHQGDEPFQGRSIARLWSPPERCFPISKRVLLLRCLLDFCQGHRLAGLLSSGLLPGCLSGGFSKSIIILLLDCLLPLPQHG